MTTRTRAAGSGDSETPELLDSVVQLTFTTMAILNTVAVENDLSLTQLRVLAILRDRRVRMSELAAYLGLDRSTLTGLVDRAEKRGLLMRAPSPSDGRAVDVFLTAAGMAMADALRADIEQALAPATSSLAPAERTRLASLLQRLSGSR